MRGYKLILSLSVICSALTVIFLFTSPKLFLIGLIVSVIEWLCFYFCCYLPVKAQMDAERLKQQLAEEETEDEESDETEEDEV